jgi:hypothetical protein
MGWEAHPDKPWERLCAGRSLLGGRRQFRKEWVKIRVSLTDPEVVARKLVELANAVEPVQDGRHLPGS